MSAPNPTSGDAAALAIDHPSLNWINLDLGDIVALAELQANESVLVVACATGELVLEILLSSGIIPGRVVAIDETVRLWDLASGQEIQKLEGHTNKVTAVAFSQDGSLLASASDDQTVRLWNPATGQETQKLGNVGYNTTLIFYE